MDFNIIFVSNSNKCQSHYISRFALVYTADSVIESLLQGVEWDHGPVVHHFVHSCDRSASFKHGWRLISFLYFTHAKQRRLNPRSLHISSRRLLPLLPAQRRISSGMPLIPSFLLLYFHTWQDAQWKRNSPGLIRHVKEAIWSPQPTHTVVLKEFRRQNGNLHLT